ncbi:undecaprenyl-diphosphatase [Priestia filamentosa]|uniref:undecaprenyl-diphosphatase n=1 Tax=Priestia filamentosa TaxID=1402861 RepID=UPI0039819CD6
MNYDIFKSINHLAGKHPFLDDIMVNVSTKALILYALFLIMIWIFGGENHKHTVFWAGVTGVLALVVNATIAHFYFEPRPFVSHAVNVLTPHDADASFPSDHTTGAFALSFAILLSHKRIGSALVAFALLTGFSRIYVGHHYPFDVLGSIIVAIVISLIVYAVRPKLEGISGFFIRIYNKIPRPAKAT